MGQGSCRFGGSCDFYLDLFLVAPAAAGDGVAAAVVAGHVSAEETVVGAIQVEDGEGGCLISAGAPPRGVGVGVRGWVGTREAAGHCVDSRRSEQRALVALLVPCRRASPQTALRPAVASQDF